MPFETVTLAEMPLPYVLGTIRYLPGRLSGRRKPQPDETSRPFLEIAGSLVLAEEPDRELVIGCIGRLHDLIDQHFVPLDDPEAFDAFDRPDYEKLVQSFRIAGGDRAIGYTLLAEHRTLALDPSARRKLSLYWYFLVGWSGDWLLRMLLEAVKRRAERAAGGDLTIGAGIRQDALRCSGSSDRGVGRDGGVSGAPSRASRRRRAIVGVKLVHSAIFLLNSAAILHIFVAGVWSRPSRWTRFALAVALTEVAVFVANRGGCPAHGPGGAPRSREWPRLRYLPAAMVCRSYPTALWTTAPRRGASLLWHRASQSASTRPGIGT